EALKGLPMLCVYGKEEKESLCRTAPAGLMTVIARNGKHHFDGNYAALGDIVYQAVVSASESLPLGDLDAVH
ncbi:MAG: AcvB/VirJ family lysyl-phosphatidylglycerol hydrolase, partial [Gemmatimonadaceae bacterium]